MATHAGHRGTVSGTGGGVYEVRLDSGGGHVEAALRGRLKQEPRTGGRIVVGDRVEVVSLGDTWTVEAVAPRTSELVRRGPGGRRPKVIAANLDRVFAVVSAADPDPTPTQVDRLLVIGEASDLTPMLVVNKVDLASEDTARLRTLYEHAGYRVLMVSALTGEGLSGLRPEVCRGTSALIGPSGVGKSSLLNALEPELHLRTGELSRRRASGRHTTVGARLLSLGCGGLVADTPGFADVGTWGVAPERVERCFPEFRALANGCRFRGCTHAHEPDCAVLAAVRTGRVAESRYGSYLTLRQEASSRLPAE